MRNICAFQRRNSFGCPAAVHCPCLIFKCINAVLKLHHYLQGPRCYNEPILFHVHKSLKRLKVCTLLFPVAKSIWNHAVNIHRCTCQVVQLPRKCIPLRLMHLIFPTFSKPKGNRIFRHELKYQTYVCAGADFSTRGHSRHPVNVPPNLRKES